MCKNLGKFPVLIQSYTTSNGRKLIYMEYVLDMGESTLMACGRKELLKGVEEAWA